LRSAFAPHASVTLSQTAETRQAADAYCRDAAVTVETARALLARRQGAVQAHEKV
jgi:hypothetical protein